MTEGDQFSYPKRDRFFAHRFVRVLHKSCAAQEIGPAACYLLCIIAHTEDAGRYAGPARFWRSQLMETLGFRSPKQLVKARELAINDGWLKYRQNGTRGVGEYYVTIPERFAELSDAAIEPLRISSASGTNSGTNNGTNQVGLVPLGTHKRNENGNITGTKSGTPPNSIPSANPGSRDSRAIEPMKSAKRRQKRPDFTPYDLTNENEVFSAHQLAVSMGFARDGYEGQFDFFSHAARAVRKGKVPAKYLAGAICDGKAQFQHADMDMATAKEMLRKIDGFEETA